MKYQLWLDESGDFVDYYEPRSSLVGGILIREEIVDKIKDTDYPEREHGHANGREWIVKYLPDKIQEMLDHFSSLKKRGPDEDDIRWVVAQNTQREGTDSSRLLYLRLLIGCVYKLYIRLCRNARINPTDEINAPELEVYAALKDNNSNDYFKYRSDLINEMSTDEKYSAYCDLLIKKITWINNPNELDANPKNPNSNPKLWFADYVCNFWYNRQQWLKSSIYKKGEHKSVRTLYEKLIANRFEIQLNEEDHIYEAKQLCEKNDISGAILYYCSLLSSNLLLPSDLNIIKKYINATFEKSCYRDNKKSIKTLMQQCEELEGKTNNYDNCYTRLKQISSIIKELKSNKNIDAPFSLILFKLDILCADCQLRIGNFSAADALMKKCTREITNNYSAYTPEMEFQFYEKMGLANIDCFRYDDAIENMKKAEKLFIKNGKETLCYGEYYGDALCMHLLALIPKLRMGDTNGKNTVYNACQRYSDIAMNQYICYESELERHRQYRALIELESDKKDFVKKAITWLIKAKCGKKFIDVDSNGYSPEEKIQSFFSSLLKNESPDTIRWYLFYYTLIMAKGKANNNSYSDIMFQELFKDDKIYTLLGISNIRDNGCILDFYSRANKKKNPPEIHPMPTIYWKLAQYLEFKYLQKVGTQDNSKLSSDIKATNDLRLQTIKTLYQRALLYFKETIPVRKIAIEASQWAFLLLNNNKMKPLADAFINDSSKKLQDLKGANNPTYSKTDLPVIMLKVLKDTSLNTEEKLKKVSNLVFY